MTTAVNGRDALDELRQAAPPDVIVLDLMMPVMDGWEFRVEQRADPMLAGIPLLAMSADLSAKARAIAADGYVRKPIDFPELLRQLHGVVGRAAKQRLAAADRMAALGTLASGIAHEINNPLTYVIANLQTLAERLPASTDRATRELSDIVADALDGAERIRKLVKQVQMVSPGQREERLTIVALREALRTALALTENQIKHRARLIVRPGPGPLRARRPRTHRATVRQPAAQRRAGDPRGARQQERDPRQRARAARAAARPSCKSRTPAPASRSRSRSGSSSRSSRPSRSGKGPGSAFRSAGASSPRSAGEISFQSEPAARDHLPRRVTDDGQARMRPGIQGVPRWHAAAGRAIYRGDSFVSSSLLSRLHGPPRLR